jgi:hypothetical protein
MTRPPHPLFALITVLVASGCPGGSEGETDEANEGDSSSSGETEDCTPGSANCECVEDECLGALMCVGGICVDECTLGSLGCGCVEDECLGANLCVDDVCVEPDSDSSDDATDDATTDDTSTDDATTDDTTDDDTTDDTTGGDGDVNTCESPDGALGCEFQAVKLRITHSIPYDPQWSMRIVIGNPGPEDADVTVEKRVDGAWTNVGGPILVSAEEMYSFYFHGADDVVQPGHFEGQAYRVTSTHPVAAHQYNADTPYGWNHGATNLLPTSVWDHDYDGISLSGNGDNGSPYLVVVAQNDNTTVQIDPKNTVQAGPDVPPTNAGFSVFMSAGDVVGVYGVIGTSMSGTRITSDPNHPIAVFAGDSFSTLVGAHDHSDEQLIGRNFAGTSTLSLVGPGGLEGVSDPDSGRAWLYAITNATAFSVSGTPNTAGLPPNPTLLDAHTLFVVVSDSNLIPEFGDVLVESTMPSITLGSGSQGLGRVTQMIPSDRLATRYAIPVIEQDADAELVIAYPDGATLTLDGQQAVPLYDPYALTPEWNVVRHTLAPGMHVLEASEPVAITLSTLHFGLSGGMQP